MPRNDSVNCFITTNGETLTEYPLPNNEHDIFVDDTKSKSAYVESKPDIPFSLHVLLRPGFEDQLELSPTGATHLTAKITVDGFTIDQWVRTHKIGSKKGWKLEPISWNPKTKQIENIKLRFSDREVTDDGVFLQSTSGKADDTGRLGEIVVKVCRYKDTPPAPGYKESEWKRVVNLEKKKITAMKGRGIAHTVELNTEPAQSMSLTRHRGSYVDLENSPFCVFRFLYRSRAHLESRNIIPRPIPTSEELTRDLTSLAIKRPNLRRSFQDFDEDTADEPSKLSSLKNRPSFDLAYRPAPPHVLRAKRSKLTETASEEKKDTDGL